jgi:hypothetical protein
VISSPTSATSDALLPLPLPDPPLSLLPPLLPGLVAPVRERRRFDLLRRLEFDGIVVP